MFVLITVRTFVRTFRDRDPRIISGMVVLRLGGSPLLGAFWEGPPSRPRGQTVAIQYRRVVGTSPAAIPRRQSGGRFEASGGWW